MQYILREIAGEERGKVKKAWIKYKKIKIDGKRKGRGKEGEHARGKCRKGRTGGIGESGGEDRISEESRKERERGRERERERRNVEWEEWRICFLNIAGLERKEREFMKNLSQLKVIVMTETCLDV